MAKNIDDLVKQDNFSKQDLQLIIMECEREQSIAPLYGVAYISNEPLTPKDIQRGQEIWKKLKQC